MQTILRSSMYRIIRVFYDNQNTPLHLRGIARAAKLNVSTTSRRLGNRIFCREKDANLVKFKIRRRYIPLLFPLLDHERLESLPILRKNAIKEYIKRRKKPVLVFGSTAKDNFKDSSDIDILEISEKKDRKAKRHAEALTGMTLNIFRISEEQFYKKGYDNVVKAALETGFPVYCRDVFYNGYAEAEKDIGI